MYKRLSYLVTVFSIILIAFVFQNPPDTRVNGASLRSEILLKTAADTYVFSSAPDTNFGYASDLKVSTALSGEQAITLVEFDLGSLPSDAIVIDATMQLFLTDADFCTEADLGIYLVTSHWSEDIVTWNSSINLTTSPTGKITTVSDEISDKDIWIPNNFVQSWIDDPINNYGLMIRNLTEGDCLRVFDSLDSLNSLPPYLFVTYYRESIFHELSGRVYQGNIGDESTPIKDVRLDLFCSNSSDDLGTLIGTTTTDSAGWYGLNGYYGCSYYMIVETDPGGYISTGATTVEGTVLSENMIQYQAPLSGQIHTGNKFWDQLDTNGFDIFLPLIIK